MAAALGTPGTAAQPGRGQRRGRRGHRGCPQIPERLLSPPAPSLRFFFFLLLLFLGAAAKQGMCQDILSQDVARCAISVDFQAQSAKKGRPNQGSRQQLHPLGKDILELTSFEDVLNQDVDVCLRVHG